MNESGSEKGDTPAQAAFRLEQLEGELAATEGPYLPFFDSRSLRLGLYALPAGARDDQPVHDDDEIYHVVAGRATLWVGDEDGEDTLIPVEPGAIVFVRAGVEHRFIDIEEDLEVLVIFGATP
ncbi:MAG: cupin domain-containing protein [Acidobacteriota bacterium]